MSRIQKVFTALKQQGKTALIPYITAGDPHPKHTVNLMHTLVEHGADTVSYTHLDVYKRQLQKRDRTLSPPTFSPNGLYLTAVSYDAKWNLPISHLSAELNHQAGIQIII